MFKLEQHFQTIVVSLATLALVWVANATTNAATQIQVLTVQVAAMQKLIDSQMEDRYRGVDAARDLRIRDQLLDSLSKRIERLEMKR